jgi:hypothetical protein
LADLRRVAVIVVGLVALVCGGVVSAGRSAPGSLNVRSSVLFDEFQDPSWTALPSTTAFNRTPSCQPTLANSWYCEVPRKRWPPQDPFSPDAYLNSGYWPAEKRADLELYAGYRFPANYKNCEAHLSHYCYLIEAKAEGYPITHTPHVGDLFFVQGRCIGYGPGATVKANCTRDKDWYMGYVEKVHPDGSFIGSEGGSDTPADSGLAVMYFSGAMDRYTEFVHLFPAGEKPKSGFTPTTTPPQLTATLSAQTVPAKRCWSVTVNWSANLPRAIQVTALQGGKLVPETGSPYSFPTETTSPPYGGVTDAIPFSGVPPGRYEVFVMLTGTQLAPVVLPLTLTP